MTVTHWLIVAAVVVVAVGWVLWTRLRPRVRRASTDEKPHYSDRGFKHFDPIEGSYGGSIRAYESSAASAPHVWVSITPPLDSIDPTVHLHLEDAVRLRDHLGYLIAHHYHLELP